MLAFSECIHDLDYSLPRTLNARTSGVGFRLKSRRGRLFYCTLIFDKREKG